MTDGHYPEGDPYGRGAEEVYGTGGHAAYPAYNAYDGNSYDSGAYGSGAYPAATAYDSGAWQTGGYDAYPQQQAVYDSGAYPTAGYGSGGYDVPAYPTDPGSGAYPGYDSGAYPAAPGYDAGYGQAASVPQQQTGYETAAWSGEVMTAVQDQPAAWTPDPWGADTSGTWSSVPAPDMWSGSDNRLGADAFADAYRNDDAATGWYETPATVHEATWQEPEAWHNGAGAGEQTVVIPGGLGTLVDPGILDADFDSHNSGEYPAVSLASPDTYGTGTYDADGYTDDYDGNPGDKYDDHFADEPTADGTDDDTAIADGAAA
ncbi:MAG: hypothetical protein HOV68_32010, partial [Streptomycetaceae bacterium]|nr:hypothetical protein [Streptomycetaceae bacterium]